MKTLSDGLLELALSKAKKIGKTVFINRTAYSNAEYLVRKFVPEDFDFDVFHTVLYIDYSKRFGVFELSSAVPDFTINLIDADPEGNGIFDCEYLINDTQTVHLWHDDLYLVGIESEKRDNPPADYEKQILELTLIHGTQEKICELFRKAERKAPTLIFFDELLRLKIELNKHRLKKI